MAHLIAISELDQEGDMNQDLTVSGLMLSLNREISGKQYGYVFLYTVNTLKFEH